jgi:hypothetical protein
MAILLDKIQIVLGIIPGFQFSLCLNRDDRLDKALFCSADSNSQKSNSKL